MHRIHDHLQVHRLQAADQCRQVELATQALQMLLAAVEARHLRLDRWGDPASGEPPFHGCGEVPFHGPTEGALDLEAQPFGWVVAGGDHQGPQGFAFHHRPAAGGGRDGGFREQRLQFTAPDRAGDRFRQLRCQEASVVTDHHHAAVQLGRGAVGQFLGGRGGDGKQALHGDVDPQDAPPTIGAELDRCWTERQRCGCHRTACAEEDLAAGGP